MPLATPIILTPTTPAPLRREAARKIASGTLVVALLGVVVMTCLVVVLLQRSRRRLTDNARVRRTRLSDAWAEAGRRAGSPPPEAFEPDPPTGGTPPGSSPGEPPTDPRPATGGPHG